MATEPSKLPRWATNPTTPPPSQAIVEPGESKKDQGWIAEMPTFGHTNWLFNLIYQWLEYLKLIGAPIGTVMFYHKDFPNTPALSDNWAELNGQTISDSESPYDGQTLPDINGEGRFLRAGSTSGTTQANQNKQHTHVQDSHNHTQDSHNHIQDAHTHIQNSHTHTQDSHSHTASTIFTGSTNIAYQSNPSSIVPVGATGTGGALRNDAAYDGESLVIINSCSLGTTVNGTTATNQSATATNQNATATNQTATATNQSTVATNQNEGGTEARPDCITLVAIMRIK